MCSLEYLSAKSVLIDKLHRVQLSQLENRKKYENILKTNVAENEKKINLIDKTDKRNEIPNYEEAQIRNKSIIDNLIRLEQLLDVKQNQLSELKVKYELQKKLRKNQRQKDETDLVEQIKISPIKSEGTPRFLTPRIVEESNNTHNKDIPPTISPRVRDSRERMHSPIPPGKFLRKSDDPETGSGKYINIEQTPPIPNIDFIQYVNIFELIQEKMIEIDRDYRRDYLNAFNDISKTDVLHNQSLENLLSNKLTDKPVLQQIDLYELVLFMMKWLPKYSVGLKFESSNISSIINRIPIITNDRIKFDELDQIIRDRICLTKDIERLWNQLVEHFDKLIQDKFLSLREVNQIFTSLFVSLPSTNCKEEQISKLLEWVLNSLEDKYKSEMFDVDSVHNVTIFSDEESVNMSNNSEVKQLKDKETASITYDHLKSSLNMANLIENSSEDDDPNDDINALFTTSINKGDKSGNIPSNSNKDKLIRSIKNIDDDFNIGTLSQNTKASVNKKNIKEDDDDDDFDFYK